MSDFSDVSPRADHHRMLWKQPRPLIREFHLISHGDVIAKIVWQSLLGSLARAESPAGAWHFEKEGVFSERVAVYLTSNGHEAAVFRMYKGGGGLLTLAGAGEYELRRVKLLYRRWQWAGADGVPLMYFVRTHSLLNFTGEVRLAEGDEADAAPPGTLALLLLFGWYLMLLRKQRMAS